MTATITPVAKHTGANITRPVDGERAGMDSGPAPLATLLQDLANRAQYARGATWGNMVGGDVFSVDTGGTNTVFTARLSAFEAARLAVMLPRPKYFEKLPQSAYLSARAATIVERMPHAQLP